jgi:NTE family protein
MRLSAARQAFHRLARHLPDELRATPEFRILDEIAQENAVAIAQLVYRDKAYESGSKDYEFSRGTMLEHWATGRQDAFNAIRDAHWLNEPMKPGITSYDMSGATHEPR